MKRSIFYILALLLFVASACSKDDATTTDKDDSSTDSDESVVEGVSFLLNGIVSSRVSATSEQFENGDMIGVQAYNAEGELYEYNDQYVYSSEDNKFSSNDPISFEDDPVALLYAVTYPALSVTATQTFLAYTNQSSATSYEFSDLLAAYSPATTSLTPSLTFYHAMSRVKLNISVIKDGESYDYSDLQFHAAVSQSLDLYNQTLAVTEGASVKDITPLEISDDSYMAILASQKIISDGFASLSFDNKTLTMDVEGVDSLSFEAGVSYTYDWDIEEYDGLLTQTLVLVETQVDNWDKGDDLAHDIEMPITLDRSYNNASFAITDENVSIAYTRNTVAAQSATITWESDNTSVATVNANGVVSLVSYGEAQITATCLGISDAVTINVPAGWWRELYDDSSKSISTITTSSSRPDASDVFMFSPYSSAITKTYDSDNECLNVQCSTNSTAEKSATVDGVSHTFTCYERVDIWCYKATTLRINPKTYPYLVYHMDNNLIKNNVIYQEFTINYSTLSNDATMEKPVLYSSDSYQSDYAEVRYLSDDSLIAIYDLSKMIDLGDYELGTSITDCLTIGVADFNYYMYGYPAITTVDGNSYSAMGTTDFNIYSIQTFASEADIQAYIASEGLTEK